MPCEPIWGLTAGWESAYNACTPANACLQVNYLNIQHNASSIFLLCWETSMNLPEFASARSSCIEVTKQIRKFFFFSSTVVFQSKMLSARADTSDDLSLQRLLWLELKAEAAAPCIPTPNVTSLQQSSTSLNFTSRVFWSPFQCRPYWRQLKSHDRKKIMGGAAWGKEKKMAGFTSRQKNNAC